jgi:predicted secreted protein
MASNPKQGTFAMPVHSLFLFPQPTDKNTTTASRPPLVAGMVAPVVDGDGGINIAAITDHPQGLFCIINPYLGMKDGDRLAVYWGDKQAYAIDVKPGDVDKPLYFFLDVTDFKSGWVERFYYVLTRAGQTVPDDPSVALRLLLKLQRPAGVDKNPHLPDGHSELKSGQLPPELIEQGVVDAEWALNGVPVTIAAYPFITVYDVIFFYWGSHRLPPHIVTQEQADKTQPIVITVDQAAILAGGDSTALKIMYRVHDQVLNWASRQSQSTTIAVDAGGWRLPGPTIKEAVNGIITIKDLNKQPVTVQVDLTATDFAPCDNVEMTWIGMTFDGTPLIHAESKDIESVPGTLEFSVPYELVKAIAMGRAEASFVLHKIDGTPAQSSKRTFADVVGDVSMLPEPKIRELVGDTLEPYVPRATVDVSYAGMASGDLINLIWLGMDVDGKPYLHEQQHTVTLNEAHANLVTIYIDSQHVKALENGTLDLSYRVSNDDVMLYDVRESERLLAKVQVIVATLPAPKVPEANNGVLDPEKIENNITVRVDFPETKKGDILTYYLMGPSASTRDWLPITTLNEGEIVNFRVDARYVHDNIGQNIRVFYSLWRAALERFEYSPTLILTVGETLGELPAPTVTQAPTGTLDPMAALHGIDISVSYTSMKPDQDIIRLLFQGTPGAGSSEDQKLPGHESGTVVFPLPASVVGANIAKNVNVQYEVTRNAQATLSKVLDLTVSGFLDPESQLPQPQVLEAAGGILDLTTFAGNASTRVAKWPFIAPKQRLWLIFEGETQYGAVHRITMLNGVEITSGQVTDGLNEVLLRSELMKLGHATSAKVICKVAFDGGTVESAALVLPIQQLTVRTRHDYVTPVISEVSDSLGQIPEGGSTFDKQVTIKGTATRGEKVALLDGSTQLDVVEVTADGNWSKLLSGLQLKRYQIIASALYDADPVASLPRTFTVAQSVAPTIANVTDSKGTVAHGGTTFDRTVTVTGKASPNQKIRLRDGTTSLIETTADAAGDWRETITGLSAKGYSLTALALYGDGAESAARTFTVAQSVAPTIANVTDSKGTVAHGGTTFDRSVTVTGKASPNQTVMLYNGSTALPPAASVDNNGNWSKVLETLSIASYAVKAKAMYDGSESAVRTFSVAEHIAPTLTSIRDESNDIPDNGETKSTVVTLLGSVTPNHQVQIYDNNVPKHSVTAIGSQWTTTLNVGLGAHAIKVKALSTGQESLTRSFTVISPIPPLTINQTVMSLNAWHFRNSGVTPSNPPAGAYGDRSAQGGVPPYRYSTDNNAAEVHTTTGRVISRGNGSATITVSDSAHQTANYQVTTSNVEVVFGTGQFSTYSHCSSVAASMGGRIPSLAEWRSFIANYGGRGPIERWCWASDSAGIGKRYVIYPATGQTDTRTDIGIGGGTADGFGIRRG